MKRIILITIAALAISIMAWPAVANANGGVPPVIHFGPTAVTLIIPPPCGFPACQTTWMLYVNEVPSGLVVGTPTAMTGTLTVAYPVGYCGIMQADAIAPVGSSVVPPRKIVGHRRTVGDCTTPIYPGARHR